MGKIKSFAERFVLAVLSPFLLIAAAIVVIKIFFKTNSKSRSMKKEIKRVLKNSDKEIKKNESTKDYIDRLYNSYRNAGKSKK